MCDKKKKDAQVQIISDPVLDLYTEIMRSNEPFLFKWKFSTDQTRKNSLSSRLTVTDGVGNKPRY